MYAGWNLIVDENNTPREMVRLETFRQPSNVMGYTHGNKIYMRAPVCPVCGDIEPAYCHTGKHAFSEGNWVAQVAHGGADKTFLVLLEHEYHLAPASAPNRPAALEMAMELLAEMLDHETETVVIESFADDYVSFRVEKNGEVIMHLDITEMCDEFLDEMMNAYIEAVNSVVDPDGIELEGGFEEGCACEDIYANMMALECCDEDDDCDCDCCGCDCEECCPGCDGCCCDDDDEDDEDDEDDDDEDEDEDDD